MRPGRERGDCAAPSPNIVHYLTTLDARWRGRKLGFTCHTGDLSWDELIAWVQEAERLGYSAFCTTEESGKDAFAVLAMSARSIHDLSAGRFGPFGLGAGGIGFMQRGHGIVVEKPLARAKETVAILRGLLTQKKFSYEGQWFKPKDFHLREGPIGPEAPPIWLAGLGPKMVGTAAEVADGVIANWLTDESLTEYRGLIKHGAESAGRDPGEVQIATLLMSCVDPTDDAAIFAARRGIAFYCASEHYLHIADICGLGADARKVKAMWEERDFDRATELVSDALLGKFCLVGTPEKNAARIQWLFDSGVYPIVYPLPRRERMVEDHHSVLEQASRWAKVLDVAPADR